MTKTQTKKPIDYAAVIAYHKAQGVSFNATAKHFKISNRSAYSILTPHGFAPMQQGREKDVKMAIAFALAHPGITQSAIARQFGIHRVTLCKAMAKVRPACPYCGQGMHPLSHKRGIPV